MQPKWKYKFIFIVWIYELFIFVFSETKITATDFTLSPRTEVIRGYSSIVNFSVSVTNIDDKHDIQAALGNGTNFNVTLFIREQGVFQNVNNSIGPFVTKSRYLELGILKNEHVILYGFADMLLPRHGCLSNNQICVSVTSSTETDRSYSVDEDGQLYIKCVDFLPFRNCIGEC